MSKSERVTSDAIMAVGVGHSPQHEFDGALANRGADEIAATQQEERARLLLFPCPRFPFGFSFQYMLVGHV